MLSIQSRLVLVGSVAMMLVVAVVVTTSGSTSTVELAQHGHSSNVKAILRQMDSQGKQAAQAQMNIISQSHSMSLGIRDYESEAGSNSHMSASAPRPNAPPGMEYVMGLGLMRKPMSSKMRVAVGSKLADAGTDAVVVPDATQYEEGTFGTHPNEQTALGVPADFNLAMSDCKGSINCMALQTKSVRGTNSERMPLYRLHPAGSKAEAAAMVPDCFPFQAGVPCY